MENKVEKQVDILYEKFVGLPNFNPIVRNGIKGDAFTLAILNIVVVRQIRCTSSMQIRCA